MELRDARLTAVSRRRRPANPPLPR